MVQNTGEVVVKKLFLSEHQKLAFLDKKFLALWRIQKLFHPVSLTHPTPFVDVIYGRPPNMK